MRTWSLILLALALVASSTVAYRFHRESSSLSSEIAALEEETEGLASEIATLKGETEELSSEIATLKGETEELSSEIAAKEAAARRAVVAALEIGATPEAIAATIPGLITDDLGRMVFIEDIPQRILSLAPSVTEILFALGLGDKVVGVTDYCDYPEEAKAKPKVGAPFPGFSLETIVDLEPQLVLSVAGTVLTQLENVGLTVVVLQPKDLSGVLRDIALVGGITGKEEEATALIDSMKERIVNIAVRAATVTEKPTVFYEIDASWNENNPWTAGSNTFQGDLIDLAGGRNIAAGRSGWYELSMEEILDADPDLIILEDYQFGVTPESVANRFTWKGLTAVKEGKVYPITDASLTSRQGPRIVDGLEEIARIIHPELFE